MKTTGYLLLGLIALVSCSPTPSEVPQIDSFNYEAEATGAFKGELRASGLRPNHRYQLTINGYKNHPSNEILQQYDDWHGEGYYDFKKVTTDSDGLLTTSIDRSLPAAKYRVKLLIKDIERNYLVVCNEDNVEFVVQ